MIQCLKQPLASRCFWAWGNVSLKLDVYSFKKLPIAKLSLDIPLCVTAELGEGGIGHGCLSKNMGVFVLLEPFAVVLAAGISGVTDSGGARDRWEMPLLPRDGEPRFPGTTDLRDRVGGNVGDLRPDGQRGSVLPKIMPRVF